MTLLTPDVLRMTSDYQAVLRDTIAATQWTGLQVVTLGARIGDSLLVLVPEADRQYRNACYYTSLDGTQVGQVVNTVTGWRAGARVRIGYPPGERILHVMDLVTTMEIDPASQDVGTPPHADQHSLRNLGHDGLSYSGKVGEDPTLVDPRQLWGGNIQPWAGMVAYGTPGWLLFGSLLQYYPGGTLADQTAYIPTGEGDARFVLVEVDRDLTVYYTYGSHFDTTFRPLALHAYVPARDANRIPLGAICLYNGMTTINWAVIWPGQNLLAVPDVPRMVTEWTLELGDLATEMAARQLIYSDAALSSPPTDAELDAAFGTPATVGKRLHAVVDSGGAGTACWLIYSNGDGWHYSAMTKAV